MRGDLAILGAVLLACAAGGARGAYMLPSGSFSETDQTFVISPGSYIGGMDASATDGIVYGEGGNVYRLVGGVPHLLYGSPQPVYSSWIVGAQGGGYYFSNSSDYGVFRMNSDGSGVENLGTSFGSYDAALDASGRLFVTRASSFTGPTQIALFDYATGESSTIATFAGPCGPLAFDSSGNLYYATAAAVFGQVGGQSIYRVSAAQIESALSSKQALAAADLEVVVSDIDTVSDMVFDDQGTLYLTSSVQAPAKVLALSGGAISEFAAVADQSHYLTNLSWTGSSLVALVGGVYGPGWDPAYGAFAELVPVVVPEPGACFALLSFVGLFGAARLRRC